MGPRPPRSTRTDTLFPYSDSLPICGELRLAVRLARFLSHPARDQTPRRGRTRADRERSARCPRQGRVAQAAAPPRDLGVRARQVPHRSRSEEHTSELQSLMRISYAVFCLKKTKHNTNYIISH